MATTAIPAEETRAQEIAPERPHGDLDPAFLKRARRESLVVFFAFWIVYGLVGYRVVIDQHVIVFDALDRMTRAYLVWHNDPPKLAAVGFGVPPMTSFVYLPFTAIKPLATSLIALPICSALFAGATLAMLDRIFIALNIPALMRLPLLVLFAINPMFAFYATNGMSESFYLWLMAVGLYCFVEWYLSEQPRFLIGAGIAFSVAMLTRYQFFIWAIFMAFMIAAALKRRKASDDKIEGSTIAYLAPIIYAAALWILFNLLILGDPFGWLTNQQDTLAVNSAAATAHGGTDFGEVASNVFTVFFGLFPLALAALAALILSFVIQRNDMALWLAIFLLVGVVTVGAEALLKNDLSTMELRDAMPMSVIGLVGAAWLMYSMGGLRIVIWAGSIIACVVALFTAWHTMQTYKYQNEEQAFVRALRTGDNQEGTSSVGGYNVGITPERQMAAFIKKNVTGRNAILTDNAQTFGVIALSGRPQNFFDRIDRGDSKWRSAVRNPFGKVQYLLIASDAPGDLIRRTYPRSVSSGVPGFSQVFKSQRYLLLRVAARNPVVPARTASGSRTTTTTTTGTGTARPFGATPTPTPRPTRTATPTATATATP